MLAKKVCILKGASKESGLSLVRKLILVPAQIFAFLVLLSFNTKAQKVTDGIGYYQEKGKARQILHKGDVTWLQRVSDEEYKVLK